MMKNLFLTSCLVLASAAAAGAADEASKPAPDRAKMIERHEQMADMHRNAAECLKGGKTVKECHEAMMKEGPAGWHGEGCEMCGEGKGWHKGKGMRMGKPAPAEAPKEEKKN